MGTLLRAELVGTQPRVTNAEMKKSASNPLEQLLFFLRGIQVFVLGQLADQQVFRKPCRAASRLLSWDRQDALSHKF